MGGSQSISSGDASSSVVRKLRDEYFVQKVQLGHGAFGVVRRAVHRATGEVRAVKSVDKRQFDAKPNLRKHLQREIEILTDCSGHANVVTLIDWFEDEHSVDLVLEYCEGGDFGDKLKQVGLGVTEKQACLWMHQILLAVEHLHSRKEPVCHRDIKPENFLVGHNGVLKLSDFGLAIRMGKKNSLRELAGTPAYQAPEIHALGGTAPAAGYGLPVDLWACGVTLYVILSGGKNPFVSAKENKLLLTNLKAGQVQFDELIVGCVDEAVATSRSSRFFSKPAADLSPSGRRTKPNPASNAEQLLRLLLTVDPSRRITSSEALRHPWFVQFGLASPPPASPIVKTSEDHARFSFDSAGGSLLASPPTMELLVNPGQGSPLSNNRSTSFPEDMFELHMQESSMTIGPRGKVVRCEKCGSFFYSHKAVTQCPECRSAGGGFALPPDGVTEGAFAYYPKAGKWAGAKIKKFLPEKGEFSFEDGALAPGASVAPPGKETGPGAPWPNGTNVMYLSGTYGTWLPAFIEGFSPGTGMYDLDVKVGVTADKIRARIKRSKLADAK